MIDGLQSVVIVGGGISGLTTALSLANVGIHSVVLERNLSEVDVGAGIQLSPNATRIFHQIGLERDLAEIGRTPSTMEWLDGETDQRIASFPISSYVKANFDAPYLQLYRPELIRTLERACSIDERIELRKGVAVEALRLHADSVVIETSTGDIRADLCVGADGTNSTVRRNLSNSFDYGRFAGFAYRTTIPLTQLNNEFAQNLTRLWLNSRFHVVTYPVGAEPVLNCVFVVESDDAEIPEDMHRQKSSRKSLSKTIDSPSALLGTLLERVSEDSLFRWPLFQFPPVRVRQLGEYPLALVGDAWHTTLPFAGQGAALAIEDAITLARSLSELRLGTLASRLSIFETVRIPRVSQVQKISARNRTVYHLGNPVLKRLRNWGAQFAYRRTTERLFGYENM